MMPLRKIQNLLLCVLLLSIQSSCLRDSYCVKLSDQVTIDNEWIELQSKPPLKAEKTFQFIVLELEPPLTCDIFGKGNGPNKGQGILMPNGDVINPDVEIIDQNGNRYNLIWRGAKGGFSSPAYSLPYPGDFPRDEEYKVVRIRSSKPIRCKAIYWYCDSLKNWK